MSSAELNCEQPDIDLVLALAMPKYCVKCRIF